jgi:hypothetical protein
MSVVGVLSGGAGQSNDGVGLDADEATGLSDAVALGQMVEDGDGRLLGESAAVQGRALALGGAGAAGVAVELAILLGLAVVAADREVAGVALTVKFAVGILAAEAREVVHGGDEPGRPGQEEIEDGSEWRHSSYVESLTMVQLACDTTRGRGGSQALFQMTPFFGR